MTLTPFLDIENMVNAGCFALLSNAVATIAGGPEVSGTFDAPYAVAMQNGPGIAGDLPQFTLPTESVPQDWEGAALVITQGRGAGAYTVRGHMPDGAGVSILALELAA